jgi:hypothetical protein
MPRILPWGNGARRTGERRRRRRRFISMLNIRRESLLISTMLISIGFLGGWIFRWF